MYVAIEINFTEMRNADLPGVHILQTGIELLIPGTLLSNNSMSRQIFPHHLLPFLNH